MKETTKNEKINSQQQVSVFSYTRGNSKFNKSGQQFFQDQGQTCSGKVKKGMNSFIDKAANFLECTRLFSNEKLEKLKQSVENKKTDSDLHQSTKSDNSQQPNNDSKVSTKEDIKTIHKQKQTETQIQLPIRDNSIQRVFKFIKRYAEYYDESYSQRQKRFNITYEEAEALRQGQYERKLKTFWGELKRLLLCQGGNQLQDLEKNQKQKQSQKWSQNNSDKVSQSMSKIQKNKRQHSLNQSQSKNNNLLFTQQHLQLQQNNEITKNEPQPNLQSIKYNKRSKKKQKNTVKVVGDFIQQPQSIVYEKKVQQQDYRHPNLQYNLTKAKNYRQGYKQRQNNQYDYKRALVNVIDDNNKEDNINSSQNSHNNQNHLNNNQNQNKQQQEQKQEEYRQEEPEKINNKNSNLKNTQNKNIFQFDQQLEEDLQQNRDQVHYDHNKNTNYNTNNYNHTFNSPKNNNNTNNNDLNNTNNNLNNTNNNNLNNTNNNLNNTNNNNLKKTQKIPSNLDNQGNYQTVQRNTNTYDIKKDNQNDNKSKKFSHTINNFGIKKTKNIQYNQEQNQEGGDLNNVYNHTAYKTTNNDSQEFKKKRKVRAKVNYDPTNTYHENNQDTNHQQNATTMNFFVPQNHQADTNDFDQNKSAIVNDESDLHLQSKKKRNKRKAHLIIEQGDGEEVFDIEQM